MTKKDYVKAAKIVVRWTEHFNAVRVDAATEAFVALFRDDNPNFDETKFREACKGK